MKDREKDGNNGAKRTGSILIGVFLLIFGYLWGGLTVYKQIFPFEQIRIARSLLAGDYAVNKSLPANPNWKQRKEQFELFGKQADVVMIGDSLTHHGHWGDIFQNIRIANRGVGNDRTDDIISRMDTIMSVKPRKAFVMVGINDLNQGKPVDRVFADYKKIVAALQDNRVQVFIQSTLECSKSRCGEILERVRELNNKLKEFAAQEKIRFIDINEGLTSRQDGLLEEYTYDGIHLVGNGYVVWSKAILPYVIPN